MYALFTKEEKFNFTAQYGMVDYIFHTKGLSTMAKTIYQVLLGELKYLHHSNRLKVDDKGIYVEMTRSVIGEKLSLCSHTVAKYIKELQRYGLLIDRRMGLKLCNRIYLKYRSDAKRYNIDADKAKTVKSENTKIENGQKNSGEAPASKTPQSTTLISKATEIIAQIIDECLPYRTINQMLILCKDNLDDLNMAVQYCFGKTPTKSYTAMLMNTLREQYHKKKKERKEKRESKPIPKISKKVSDFNKMAEHEEWDFDKLEMAQRYHVQRKLGSISEEEYKQKIAELGISL